ncbi:MAG TPA: hypothetical protein VGP90_04570 [Acidimicrobiia bacterium]|nr:hypothetical protein [Acidimicrobiia bacterium]
MGSVTVPPTSLSGSFGTGLTIPLSAVVLVVAWAGCVSAPATGTGVPGADVAGVPGVPGVPAAGAGEFAVLDPEPTG